MDGNGKSNGDETEAPATVPAMVPPMVPHVALSAHRGPPPSKAFIAKSYSARSLMGGAAKASGGTLLDRLHGKGPVVKWPSSVKTARSHVQAGKAETESAVKGENMSERFIAERLMSDRGASSFNPQIPRRMPDIPSPASVKAAEADMDGKRMVIGRAVRLSGEIGGCERLVVEGKVDATLSDVKTLEVGAQGNFKGTAAVETASIAGTFEGTLKVSGHLEIGAAAVVKGAVSYGTIAIANGGKLLGTIESV